MSDSVPRCARSRTLRLTRLCALVARRSIHRLHLRLSLFGGWIWVAAASLIGFEALEILLGAFITAPELLPLALLALAAIWLLRRTLTRRRRRRATPHLSPPDVAGRLNRNDHASP
ncbi:hypothetical protein [Humibacter ginsenosidimutans]|uniref:Uncharacterized protein n=1 Tax=Humibacter ginsenosidimutans TaxID=2599293 RepID=A0A5B8M729_9MICO|nr:hypothetical protein [Humibacter ginsenosidimutans]QDZ16538.1 hypothetical protein FPZ11_18900 [Humibacter ginsenosidimutans]